MGSKSKKTKAWAAAIAAQKTQQQINNYNAGEKQRGATLDKNFVAQKNAIVQKEGTIDYKRFLKSRLNDIGNVLGVKK